MPQKLLIKSYEVVKREGTGAVFHLGTAPCQPSLPRCSRVTFPAVKWLKANRLPQHKATGSGCIVQVKDSEHTPLHPEETNTR